MAADPPLPDGPVLIVSPAMGDAAASCAALLDRSEPVTVLDVFTSVPEPDHATEWDRRCGFASAKEAMAAWEHEEAEAFTGTAHEVLAVDLLAHRYGDGARGEPDVRRLRDAVVGWLGRTGGGVVVVPAGAGIVPGAPLGPGAAARAALTGRDPHRLDPDHLWVRDTVLRELWGRQDTELWLYEELPLARAQPADRAVGVVARWMGCPATLHVAAVDRAAKAARILAYASQAAARFGARSPRRVRRRIPGRERYWRLDAPAPPSA